MVRRIELVCAQNLSTKVSSQSTLLGGGVYDLQNLSSKSNAQKQIARSSFGHKFHEIWGEVSHKFVDFIVKDFNGQGRFLMRAL